MLNKLWHSWFSPVQCTLEQPNNGPEICDASNANFDVSTGNFDTNTSPVPGEAMGRKKAYVVFHGRKPGLYYTWGECQEQVNGFSGAKVQGYTSRQQAEDAWGGCELRRLLEAALKDGMPAKKLGNEYHLQSPLDANPLTPAKRARRSQTIEPQERTGGTKEPGIPEYIVITSDEEEEPRRKKPKTADFWAGNADSVQYDEVEGELDLDREEGSFELTAAQQAVVEMAMNRNNMFLTGAAGSGKTATLKEILRRLREKHLREGGKDPEGGDSNVPYVQVVAPTGIAALPLNGKTTYSFAGWNMNSFQQPLEKLLGTASERVRKAMRKLKVLIIEEISMVESQFLERLNCLMQHVRQNYRPFGGVQVIFVGDFHQLPPVKPFQFCLHCGEVMANQNTEPMCSSEKCARRGMAFKSCDKWAFRAPVWKDLHLRHVKLEQIHRQKDVGFQDVLNKIRNGVLLTDDEWDELTVKKDRDGAFPIRLMSRREQVRYFNMCQLGALKSKACTWDALDSARKLSYSDEDKCHPRVGQILRDLETYKESLKDHRLPTTLALKVGARVVLLSNLNPEGGLVNGSQGEVVKFVDTTSWPVKKQEGKGHNMWRAEQAKINEFQRSQGFQCPVVRFTCGKTVTVRPIVQESLRGRSNDRYLVSRIQIPLTLAWALSIHKSQGMTLEHVEVSSNDIFESGQLYVGFSRATKLEGLTVTGYSREQLSTDKDILEFYDNAPWEDLEASNESKVQADIDIEFVERRCGSLEAVKNVYGGQVHLSHDSSLPSY